MSNIISTPETFGKDMEKIFKTYTEEVTEAVVKEVYDTGTEAVEKLRTIQMPAQSEAGSARPMKRRTWNRYSGSWGLDTREGNNYYHCTVRNKRHYRLTHLLEKGHATRNGTHTRAFKHIEPVNDYCQERLIRNIPIIIGGK